jgi:peptide-methionine (S)-S-oxide reductase
VAEAVIREAQGHYRDRIVTEVIEAGPYWRAEDYHQEYFRNNPGQGYCMFVVAPKVEKFLKTFSARRKKSTGD